jgi:hypothetical protein
VVSKAEVLGLFSHWDFFDLSIFTDFSLTLRIYLPQVKTINLHTDPYRFPYLIEVSVLPCEKMTLYIFNLTHVGSVDLRHIRAKHSFPSKEFFHFARGGMVAVMFFHLTRRH